ncbi:MAG: type II toxin-antitoxin system VapC family toxin [Anaerolineae bacterium]|nr:type II toxin-antitoxin system VapC family toxin [Anaerolineae bacterium]
MSGNLLDTNAVIALQRGDENLLGLLAQADEWYLSATVVGELYYGAYRSGRIEANLEVVDRLVDRVRVLPVDAVTARIFGDIHQSLRSKGRPIPENDLWIAATALQYKLALVTNDEHFNEVDGLDIKNW